MRRMQAPPRIRVLFDAISRFSKESKAGRGWENREVSKRALPDPLTPHLRQREGFQDLVGQSTGRANLLAAPSGSSLMEEATLQKSSSSIRNSTQFANMLLRKSLTNQLIDKVHVTMRQVVQNLLNQPEFEAIICEYAKHHDFNQIDSAPWLLLILLVGSRQ